MKQTDFIVKLQAEARLQARLEQQRVLPKSLDFLTNFIAKYTWQVILFFSLITALVLEKI